MSATLLSAWEKTVAAAPRAIALSEAESGQTLTRRELDALGEAWRAAQGAGLAGRPVLFAERNGRGWLQVFLGLLKAGAVAVPLDPGEPPAAQRAIAESLCGAGVWREGRIEILGAPRTRRDGRRLIKLTSGSTGAPRAIVFTDAQMLADGRQVCAGMDIRADDVNFALIPMGHSYGLGNLVVPLLQQGTAIVCGATALPQAIAAEIARWRPTVFPTVPAILRALVEADIAPAQLASLRTVISAGAPLAAEIAAAFHARFGQDIHSFYGSSETGGITYDRIGAAAREGRSVGAPLPGVRLEFGRGGRFTIESAAVFTIGNDRRGTRGWGRHRPADLAALNDRGELVLRGRIGRTVKIAGRRVELAEIERALRGIAGVREAWVAPHPTRAEALAAAVATTRPAEEIRVALRERIAAWKIPKKILPLAEFPLTARGKTDTARLREMLR